MSTTYTDEVVQRLVNTAVSVTRNVAMNEPDHERLQALITAVKPFLPDPDADLIEAMAIAAYDAVDEGGTGWSDENPDCRERYLIEARAALAVVKDRGLPS